MEVVDLVEEGVEDTKLLLIQSYLAKRAYINDSEGLLAWTSITNVRPSLAHFPKKEGG